jgi:hypothetical protein
LSQTFEISIVRLEVEAQEKQFSARRDGGRCYSWSDCEICRRSTRKPAYPEELTLSSHLIGGADQESNTVKFKE